LDFRQELVAQNAKPGRISPSSVVAGICFIWLSLLCCAFATISAYQSKAGFSGFPTATVDDFHLRLRTNSSALIVAVHPKCPCTRATVAELAKVLGRSKAQPDLVALIYTPTRAKEEWLHSGIVEALSKLGFRIIEDRDGFIAGQLGAETSGHVLFYGENGALVFGGGITASRGHEGDNAAEDRLIELLNGNERTVATPGVVYGCALRDHAKEAT
jgi:hypothetical protein